MMKVYGLKNCDTCRKARKWLDAQGIAHEFLDVRADGVSGADLERFMAQVGWETLVNKRGTTWRQLSEDEKDINSAEEAVALLLKHPAIMKRPVFAQGQTCLVGFAKAQQDELSKMTG